MGAAPPMAGSPPPASAPWRQATANPSFEPATHLQTPPSAVPWRTSAPASGGIQDSPWRKTASSDSPGMINASATNSAPWSAVSAGVTQSPVNGGDASGGFSIGDLLSELDKVAQKPDISHLLDAVNQVTQVVNSLPSQSASGQQPSQEQSGQIQDTVLSSPERIDDGSPTDASDSATEDTDYDPFNDGKRDESPIAPAMDDDEEDEGIVEALFDMLRTAEEVAPKPEVSVTAPVSKPAPVSKSPVVSRTTARAPVTPAAKISIPPKMPSPAVLQEEERSKPKTAATSYVFNPATQRWEPKKVSTPEPSPASKAASGRNAARDPRTFAHARQNEPPERSPQSRVGVDSSYILIGEEEEPKPSKVQTQTSSVIAECEAQARADAANGQASYPQALAVRLALRFESKPADMLKTMEQAGLPAAKDQRSTVKAIMRLCHPDKCKHSLAKRAMQAMQPLLS